LIATALAGTPLSYRLPVDAYSRQIFEVHSPKVAIMKRLFIVPYLGRPPSQCGPPGLPGQQLKLVFYAFPFFRAVDDFRDSIFLVRLLSRSG